MRIKLAKGRVPCGQLEISLLDSLLSYRAGRCVDRNRQVTSQGTALDPRCSNSSYKSSTHLTMTNVLGTSAIAGHSETPPAYLNTAEQNGDIRPLEVGHRGDGFPRNRNFFIRKKGTELYLLNDWLSHTEGALLHLWPLQAVHDIGRKNQV